MRIQPRSKDGVSPYKILYGRPYQTPLIPGDMKIAGETDLKMYLISLFVQCIRSKNRKR